MKKIRVQYLTPTSVMVPYTGNWAYTKSDTEPTEETIMVTTIVDIEVPLDFKCNPLTISEKLRTHTIFSHINTNKCYFAGELETVEECEERVSMEMKSQSELIVSWSVFE